MRLFGSIQGKLVALLALFFVVQCVVLFVISWELSSVSDRYRGVIEDDLQQKARVDMLNVEFKTQVQEWKNVLLRGHEQKDFDKYWGTFTQQQQRIQSMSKDMAQLETDSAIQGKLQAFTSVHHSIFAKYQQGKEVFAFQAADHKAADQVVRGIDREPSNILKEASALINQRALNRTQELNSLSATLTTSVYWLVILMSVVACIVLTLLVRGLLVKPVLGLRGHAYKMASGDFSHEIRVGRGDEIGALSKALNKMRSELCVMLTSVAAASNQLSSSSGALSGAAQRIDDDTHHAQDHAGQIAAAMTEMSASIAEVASNAAIAADATDVANQGAGDGMRIMEEAIGAITAVADEVVKISADMTRLEQDTTSVGAVLDVIKGIAEQTNLLALNAAIEAARAGEQGRGFAVVADEVRALAKRTQESTEEIHHIIEAVQNGAKAAAGGMDAGSQKTEHAVSLAREAGEAIRKIVNEINRVQGMSSQIATAAEEQAAATEEINRNVVNMTTLSEKAHESAANAHDVAQGLSEIASGLHGTAGRFKLPR